MISALDSNGDWTFGSGLQNYLSGQAGLDQNLGTKLLTFRGECFFALNDGVDWWNLIGGKNPAAQAAIILQTRAVIAATEDVVRVTSVFPALTGRRLSLTYTADSIYSVGASQTLAIPPS